MISMFGLVTEFLILREVVMLNALTSALKKNQKYTMPSSLALYSKMLDLSLTLDK